jgi:Leucine Rich repeat
VIDDGISAIAEGCPHMQNIDLTRCRQITDEGAAAIDGGCPNVRSISLAARIGYGRDITDDTLSPLANGGPLRQSIDLTCCEVTDDGVIALAMGCPQLCSVN